MGIPAYYKKLLDAIPDLIKRNHQNVDWLFMDFNCLIYHCLHRADTPVYPGADGKEEWEAQFIECIVRYCLNVIKQVSPKSGVYMAIDGVVPMAKMRQQRLRRFKSVWLKREETTISWDTNAITPGTDFMKKLHAGLEKMIKQKGKKSWTLSSSNEPGEGEHKIMAQWRTGKYKGNFAVYGLDADLIVLSLLGQVTNQLENEIWLFREEVDKGQIVYNDQGEEHFEWFSINALRDWLAFPCSDKPGFLIQYCFAMSVLGNDFLPSSLGLKIREDGHTELLLLIRMLKQPLVTSEGISLNGLLDLFQQLSQTEAERIGKYVQKKRMHSRNLLEKELPVGDNNWPLLQMAEEVILDPANPRQLARNWQTQYQFHFFPGWRTKPCRDKMIADYLQGMQWIWAYYTGKMDNVCFNWYYPHSLPPLWEWIYDYLSIKGMPAFEKIEIRAEDIQPVEQLALVLPLESWHLIPACKAKNFPTLAPQYFPASFHFESVGKRFFWECEALIPMPTILELKSIVS